MSETTQAVGKRPHENHGTTSGPSAPFCQSMRRPSQGSELKQKSRTAASGDATTTTTKPQRITAADAALKLHELSEQGLTGDRVTEFLDLVANLIGAFGVVFLSRSEEHPGRLVVRPGHLVPQHLTHLRSLLQHVSRLAAVAAAEETPQAGNAENGEDLLVVAVPVLRRSGGNEAICVVVGVGENEQARSTAAYLILVLQWFAAFVEGAQNAPGTAISAEDTSAYRMLRKASQEKRFSASCSVVAEWVKTRSGAKDVVVGVRGGWGGSRVVTYTGAKDVDHRSDRLGAFRELLEETVIAGEIKASDGDLQHIDQTVDEIVMETSASERLSRNTGLSVVDRFALFDASGKPYGAVLCMGAANDGSDPVKAKADPLSVETQLLLGQQLDTLRAAQRTTLFNALGLQRLLTKAWFRHPLVWIVCAALIGILLVPMPLQIKCDCVIQPKQRRFVSVPYEGRLEEVLAEPGQIVSEGQLLATMDGHEIELEISSLRAEQRKAEKDYDTALAAFDTSQAQMASLEAKRLKLKIEAAEDRLRNLEIRSPVDGVVIGGDPRKMQGARLSIGESLMEVGPMDEMIVELQVPDEDIAHVRSNLKAQYRLTALPWKTLDGEIQLIHPQSETRDGSNVFVAELGLDNPDQSIRPGMRGQAKILSDPHPLGWNLFHKAWDGFVSWVAW